MRVKRSFKIKTALFTLITAGMLVFGGCSSDTNTTNDTGTKQDQGVNTDTTTGSDSQSDTIVSSGDHQTVINVIKVPETKDDYAQDINGDGTTDNKVGQIINTIDTAAGGKLGLQIGVDEAMAKGTILMLLELVSESLVESQSATLTAYQGEDTDNAPLNNLSGSGVLKKAALSGQPQGIQGKIAGGKFSGSGTFSLVVPLLSEETITVKLAKVEADVEANALKNGKVAGAIPLAEIESKILPTIGVTYFIFYNSLPAGNNKTLMENLVKEQSAEVCAGNATVCSESIIAFAKNFLSADIDTDGDTTKDAVSIGVGFDSIKCSFLND